MIRVNEFVEKGEELKLNQGATDRCILCDWILSQCHQCVNGEFSFRLSCHFIEVFRGCSGETAAVCGR